MSDGKRQEFLVEKQLALSRGDGDQQNRPSLLLGIQLPQHASDRNETGISGNEDQFPIKLSREDKISIRARKENLIARVEAVKIVGTRSTDNMIED